MNVSSYANGPISPGEMVVIFGFGIGAPAVVGAQLDQQAGLQTHFHRSKSCSTEIQPVDLRFRKADLGRAAFVLVCAGSLALGQGKQEDFSSKRVELMTHGERIAFLKLASDLGTPADMADRVGLIVLNREEEALPILIELSSD